MNTDKAFIIEVSGRLETFIGQEFRIKTYRKKYKLIETMSVEEWQSIEKKKHKNSK